MHSLTEGDMKMSKWKTAMIAVQSMGALGALVLTVAAPWKW